MIVSPSRPTSPSGSEASKVLYSDDRFHVSPSWLAFDNSKYAIRTIVRLDFKSIKPALGVHYAFIVAGLLLMIYSAYHFNNEALSPIVPAIMLIASVAMCVIFGAIVLQAKASHHIQVRFIDGGKKTIAMSNIDQANGVLESLTEAMDWHRSGDVVLEAQRSSHVRKGYAVSSWDEEQPEQESDEFEEPLSSYARATKNAQDHPTRVERRTAQKMAALMIAMRNKWRN